MKKQLAFFHELVLFTILTASVITFWYARGQTQFQIIIGIITAIAYILWGIIHHILKEDLHARIVIEYVLVGLIAIVLLITLAL